MPVGRLSCASAGCGAVWSAMSCGGARSLCGILCETWSWHRILKHVYAHALLCPFRSCSQGAGGRGGRCWVRVCSSADTVAFPREVSRTFLVYTSSECHDQLLMLRGHSRRLSVWPSQASARRSRRATCGQAPCVEAAAEDFGQQWEQLLTRMEMAIVGLETRLHRRRRYKSAPRSGGVEGGGRARCVSPRVCRYMHGSVCLSVHLSSDRDPTLVATLAALVVGGPCCWRRWRSPSESASPTSERATASAGRGALAALPRHAPHYGRRANSARHAQREGASLFTAWHKGERSVSPNRSRESRRGASPAVRLFWPGAARRDAAVPSHRPSARQVDPSRAQGRRRAEGESERGPKHTQTHRRGSTWLRRAQIQTGFNPRRTVSARCSPLWTRASAKLHRLPFLAGRRPLPPCPRVAPAPAGLRPEVAPSVRPQPAGRLSRSSLVRPCKLRQCVSWSCFRLDLSAWRVTLFRESARLGSRFRTSEGKQHWSS